MKIEDFIKENNIPVTIIPEKTNYWLVRTQGGQYYEEFINGQFIGINWDEFSDLDEIKNTAKEDLVEKIKTTYEDKDGDKPPHAGMIYGQIHRFCSELDVGDIVMIPSSNSSYISFGRITSAPYIEDVDQSSIDEGACPFKKRRTVEWLKPVSRGRLDPYLYRMMQSHHTISNATEYAKYIDRTLHSFYLKGKQAYFVVEVNQTRDIAALDLIEFVSSALDIVPLIQNPEDPTKRYKKEDIELKLNVQSPGVMEFSANNIPYLILILGAVIIYFFGTKFYAKSGSSDEAESTAVLEHVEDKPEVLLTIAEKQLKSGEKLKVNIPKANKEKLDL